MNTILTDDDRQRVPKGWKLVPVEPTIEMLEAMHTENLTFYASEQREAYAAMLAAAPEAPAQAGAVDERAAFEEWYETAACIGIEPTWAAWQARAALAQKGRS